MASQLPFGEHRGSVGWNFRRIKNLVVGLIVLGIAVGYGIYSYGKASTAWLVSGLPQPYAVTINGETHTLEPFAVTSIRLSGNVTVAAGDETGAVVDNTFEIRDGLIERFISKKVFVVNPDMAAVLLWEQAEYSDRPKQDGSAPPRAHVGQSVYTFDGIDFPFEPFPEEVELSSGRRSEMRERLSLLGAHGDLESLAWTVAVEVGHDEVLALVRRRMSFDDPDDVARPLYTFMEPEAFIESAREHLDVRPVRVEWHRCYQDAADLVEGEPDLLEQYRALSDADPHDGDLMYLFGRRVDDPDDAEEVYRRAGDADRPSAHAHRALAYWMLIDGRYESARDRVNRAVAAAPNLDVAQLTLELQHALGEFDTLLELVRERLRIDATDTEAMIDEVYYLARRGPAMEVPSQVTRHLENLKDAGCPPIEHNEIRQLMLLAAAGATDDVAEYTKLARQSPSLGYESDALLLAGDLAGAATLLDAQDSATLIELIVQYSAARVHGDRTLAEDRRELALDMARADGDESWALWADWLESANPPTAAELRSLELLPPDRRVALLGLGAAFPAERDRFWNAARTLNYDRRWPYLSVRYVLDQS